MRKIISLLSIIVILVVGILIQFELTSIAATGDTANISVDTKDAAVGETVTININLQNTVDFVAGNFELTYDDSKLSYQSYTIGNSLKNSEGTTNGTIYLNTSTSGTIRIGYMSDVIEGSATKNAGVLLSLTFNVIDGKGTVTELPLTCSTLKTADGTDVQTNITNGSIQIVNSLISISLDRQTLTLPKDQIKTLTVIYNPEDTQEDKTVTWKSSDDTVATVDSTGLVTAIKDGQTTITATVGDKTATCVVTVSGMLGDIDKDNNITAYDAYKALEVSTQILAEKQADEETILILDVNKDGTLTANDAYEILKYSVGLITEF